MLYHSTKSLLNTILHALDGADEIAWDDHTESLKECLFEMFQMATPGVASSVDNRASEKLLRAIPHVKSMLSAIRRQDRAKAVEHGKAAFAKM